MGTFMIPVAYSGGGRCGISEGLTNLKCYIWEVAASEIAHCKKLPLGKLSIGRLPLEKYLTPYKKPECISFSCTI